MDLQHQPQCGVEAILARADTVDNLGGGGGGSGDFQADEADFAKVAQQPVSHGRDGEDLRSEIRPVHEDIFEETQQQVGANCPLMGLINNDHAVALQERVGHHLSEEQVISVGTHPQELDSVTMMGNFRLIWVVGLKNS